MGIMLNDFINKNNNKLSKEAIRKHLLEILGLENLEVKSEVAQNSVDD